MPQLLLLILINRFLIFETMYLKGAYIFNGQVVLATTAERETELSGELNPIITATNKKAAIAKQLLTRLKEETERLKSQNGPKDANALRIRDNLVNTLTRKFVDVMKEYQNAQQKFKTDIKKKVKRQVQIVKPDATTEEIDAVLKSGGGAGDVFKNAILKVIVMYYMSICIRIYFLNFLQGDAADPIRNAYMNVADKYQDVLTLEASVAELHQMFVDFALLTEQQGELLDQIEFQVKAASDFIDEGNVELVESIELQKQIRRRQLCIFIILLVVIGVIILIIMGVTGHLK